MSTPPAPSARPPRDWSRAAFITSAIALVFAYGVAVGVFHVFPYRYIKVGLDAVADLRTNWRTAFRVEPTLFLDVARYPGSGVTRRDDAAMAPGLTLLAAFIGDHNEARLIRADGTVVQRWPLSFSRLMPDTSHIQPRSSVPESEWNVALHDALVEPDGSLVFDFDYFGLVKVDRCGSLVWRVPRMIHHSIEPAEDGSLWVSSLRYYETNVPYPHVKAPFTDETVMKVSAGGEVLQERSVFEMLVRYAPALYFGNASPNPDPIHINDVEALPSRLAAAFPRFAAGDLLLSLRGLSMLLVADAVTGDIKWSHVSRLLRQHDPDFQPTGVISAFNNNTLDDESDLDRLRARSGQASTADPIGYSEIVEIDPETQRVHTRYGGRADQPMFSRIRGQHAYLPNGNLLITESIGGRVIEVAPDGRIVWEYVNRYDDTRAAIVYQARRYPANYFTVADWTCR